MAIPNFDDVVSVGEKEVLRKPTRFSSSIVTTEGSNINVIVAAGAAMSDETSRFAQNVFNGVHLSTAIREGGEVLDRLLWDWYQLIRFEAAQAVVTLEFSRPTATVPVTIPAGSVVSTEDGQPFETVNDVVMGIGVLGPVSVTAFAQIAGSLGNAEPGAIETIVTALADPEITATNPEVAAGGGPEETNEEFGQRGRDFFVNARRGTRQAILNGCLGTKGVARATVTEDLNVEGFGNYRVKAIISDSFGQANGALANAVSENLEETRALGVPVRVLAGTPQFVNIVIEGLTFESGANTTNLIDQIRAQVVSRVNQLAPKQPLQSALILSALQVSRLVSIPDDVIKEPLGDLIPSSATGVIRTTKSRVSINGQSGGT